MFDKSAIVISFDGFNIITRYTEKRCDFCLQTHEYMA